MEIFKLVGSIFVDNEDADKSLVETDKKALNVGKTFSKVGKTVGKFGKIAAIGIGVGAGAMVALASKTGEAADRLLDLNSITGLSTDEIQKWERVTTVAGVSVDAMTNVSQKLTKTMDILSTGTGKASETAAKLGLDYEKLEQLTPDERMNALVSALGSVEDKQERARLGTDLLGGSWKELAPILDVGAERLQEIKDNANIISNEDLNQANEFRIKIDQMKERVGVFGQELAVKFIPLLNKMFDWFNENMPMIEIIVTKAFKVISIAIESLTTLVTEILMPVLQTLWEWIEPNIPAIKEFFIDAFETIAMVIDNAWMVIQEHLLPVLVSIFEWVIKNMPVFKLIFKTVFDTIFTVVQSVWSILEVTLFPILKVLFKWASDNMPLFQAIFETAFKAINTAVEFTQGVIEGIIKTITDMIDAIKKGLRFLADFNEAEKPGTPQGKAKDSAPGLATGGTVVKSGLTRINEGLSGELVNLPGGSTVIPLNGQSVKSALGKEGLTLNFNIDTLVGDDTADKLGDILVERLYELGIGV